MQLVCNAGFCRWVPKSDLDVEWQGEHDKESNAKLQISVKFMFSSAVIQEKSAAWFQLFWITLKLL